MVVACLVADMRGKSEARPKVERRDRSCMSEVEKRGVSGGLVQNKHSLPD